MEDRVKRFAGVGNFRDFGGYTTRSGGQVKRGRLYRSAHFGEASEEDLAVLDAIGIGFVVDLRRNVERTHNPTRWPKSGGRPELIMHDSGDVSDPAFATFLRHPTTTAAHTRDHMIKDYSEMPFEPRYIALFSQFLKKLSAGHGPALVHCMAGKDRTGIICAVVLKLLGVSDDDVVEDYLLTNKLRTDEEFAKRLKQFSDYVGHTLNPDVVRSIWRVEADYLASAFAAMERQSGSFDAYVERVLELTPAERRDLRGHLIESR
jgi:protein tyrosine/serine phosphatase